MCHDLGVAEREGWTVEVGTPEEIEARRIARWRAMTPNQRLAALAEIRRQVLGTDEERLERTYRIVTVPRR